MNKLNGGIYISETAEVTNTSIGEHSKIYKNVTIGDSIIGSSVTVGDFTYVDNSRIGNQVQLQRFNTLYSSRIDDSTYTGRNTTIWYADIGKYCSISWNVSIGGANHNYKLITSHAFLYSDSFGILGDNQPFYNRFNDACTIGNDVWIGCNSVITRNVNVGDGAVIGAGAVVTKDVPPYAIVAGVPAKVIKLRCSEELIEKMLDLRWWDFPRSVIQENVALFSSTIDAATVDKIKQISPLNETSGGELK